MKDTYSKTVVSHQHVSIYLCILCVCLLSLSAHKEQKKKTLKRDLNFALLTNSNFGIIRNI